VVDSASIAVNRRYRRAKPDRLAGHTRLTMRLRSAAGERQGWSVVRVPRVADADRRPLHRELLTAQRDRTRVSNRLQGWLAGYGVRRALHGDVEAQLEQGHQEDGSLLPPALRARLKRAWQQGGFLPAQITARAGERRAALHTRQEPVLAQGRPLSTLRGIGVNRAWLFVMACFAWRALQTPKQGGA
jgi:transposase